MRNRYSIRTCALCDRQVEYGPTLTLCERCAGIAASVVTVVKGIGILVFGLAATGFFCAFLWGFFAGVFGDTAGDIAVIGYLAFMVGCVAYAGISAYLEDRDRKNAAPR
jgi:hypothetical protein